MWTRSWRLGWLWTGWVLSLGLGTAGVVLVDRTNAFGSDRRTLDLSVYGPGLGMVAGAVLVQWITTSVWARHIVQDADVKLPELARHETQWAFPLYMTLVCAFFFLGLLLMLQFHDKWTFWLGVVLMGVMLVVEISMLVQKHMRKLWGFWLRESFEAPHQISEALRRRRQRQAVEKKRRDVQKRERVRAWQEAQKQRQQREAIEKPRKSAEQGRLDAQKKERARAQREAEQGRPQEEARAPSPTPEPQVRPPPPPPRGSVLPAARRLDFRKWREARKLEDV